MLAGAESIVSKYAYTHTHTHTGTVRETGELHILGA